MLVYVIFNIIPLTFLCWTAEKVGADLENEGRKICPVHWCSLNFLTIANDKLDLILNVFFIGA